MDLLFYLAIVPALGVAAQWLAWRTNLPGILLLLCFGVVLGQFVSPDDYFSDLTGGNEMAGPQLLFPLVSMSVAVIMFEGGLSLKLSEVREAGGAALRLVTVGALLTFAGATVAAQWILGFEWQLSLLVGAILVVTGPTVIGPLLRQVRPRRRVGTTLKWEGIVIDPVGAILAVLIFDQVVYSTDSSAVSAIIMLVKTVTIGTAIGVFGGIALTEAFRRYLVPDNLHGVVSLAVVLFAFAASNSAAHESGLISVTVIGMWLSNQKYFDVEHIIELKENLRTLLIGCLFIVLGSRVDLADVAAIGLPGVAFLAALILVVRPVAVFLSMAGSKLSFREQAFVAGLAPRGIVAAAVSSVFALELATSDVNIEGADQLATVTFLVIVGTVAVYGLSASPLAKLLGLADESNHGILIAGADAWVRDLAGLLNDSEVPVLLVDTNYTKVSAAKMSGIPAICANALNEHAREDFDLSGIGRMMALTPNDEVNSLALRECRTIFDSSHQYQLSFRSKNSGGQRGMTRNLMGRELFGEGLTFAELRDRHDSGARFKATTITDSYTYEDFVTDNPHDAVLILAISEEKTVTVNTVDAPLRPSEGQTLIVLVPAKESESGRSNVADPGETPDAVERVDEA